MDPARLSFSAPSTFAAMDGLTERVQAFLDVHVTDEDLSFRVALVTSEAVTNAMEHGNTFNPDLQVHVDLVHGRDAVVVQVCDEGPGFDPASVPHPVKEGSLLAEGGRGLYLMRELADDVRFEQEGRCVVLTLHPR